MALDAALLALTAAELHRTLGDARIDKIFQPTRDEVLLGLRSREGAYRLLLCARSGSARVALTQESYENPQSPPSFCMLLRKHLAGGRLAGIVCPEDERIAFFHFTCTDDMGDLVGNTLAAELMGRYCNLVLVRRASPDDLTVAGGRIIDALKRVDFEDSEIRQLLPGLPYTLPPRPDALSFLAAPFAAIAQRFGTSQAPLPDALRKAVSGVGPVVVREACYRALGAQFEKPAASLTPTELSALEASLAGIRAEAATGGQPNLVRKEDGTPFEFSFTHLTQYGPAVRAEDFPGYSALLEGYYAQKDRAERLRQKSKELRKTVQTLYDRAVRKQAAREQELADSENSEALRVFGELLTANLHALQKGQPEVTLANWYAGNAPVRIPLDVRLTPSGNAQRYFRDYKKRQTAQKMLAQLLVAGAREIQYLETVLYEVENASGEAALAEIRAELQGAGYLRHTRGKEKRQKPQETLRYLSADGFAIQVGRNNTQNDKLTLKTARGKDLWFHVKNAPGSHVVVMSEGRDIPLATQNEAAMLAVWYSGQRHSAKVPVDFTEVKNIRKTGDLPPGMVLYEHYETAYVTPEPAVLERLGAL